MEETGRRANKRQSKEYWLEHVKSWQKSGMNQADYCRGQGISRWAFYGWRRKLAVLKGSGRFVEAPIHLSLGAIIRTVELEVEGINIRLREDIEADVLRRIVDSLRWRNDGQ